jgi:hypothetical protein
MTWERSQFDPIANNSKDQPTIGYCFGDVTSEEGLQDVFERHNPGLLPINKLPQTSDFGLFT